MKKLLILTLPIVFVSCGQQKTQSFTEHESVAADLFDFVSPDQMEEMIQNGEVDVIDAEDESQQQEETKTEDQKKKRLKVKTPESRSDIQMDGGLLDIHGDNTGETTTDAVLEIRVYRRNPKKTLSHLTKEHVDIFLNKVRIYTFLASGGSNGMKYPPNGRPYVASTRPGTFGVRYLSRNHRSNLYGGALMEYAIFYDGGRAIHATYGNNRKILGQPASGGCVRLAEENAATLWDVLMKVKSMYGIKAVKVVVSDLQDKMGPMYPQGKSQYLVEHESSI